MIRKIKFFYLLLQIIPPLDFHRTNVIIKLGVPNYAITERGLDMSNYIIVAILAVLLYFGLRSSAKHFRGEGGCCGGGTYKARKKKLNTIISKKTFAVEGMSCQHCVNRVMEAVNSIDGASALVKLKKGIVIVSLEHPVSNEIIKDAIEKAGYKVTDIRES